MIDTIRAITGRRFCDWCTDRPDNWIERRFGGYQSEATPLSNVVWWVYTHGGLGLWRIGQWWHHRWHHR